MISSSNSSRHRDGRCIQITSFPKRRLATDKRSGTSRQRTVPATRRNQRGNAILESALIFLPLMALVFGTVDVCFALFIQSSFNTATREGVRFGITYSTSYNGNSCAGSEATCISQVVQDNAIGFLSGSRSNYITINYYTANDLSHPVMACNAGSCSTSVCGGASTCTLPQTLSNGIVVNFPNQSGNIVEVVVANYPWNWMVPIPGYSAGTGLTLGAASMDVMNALPVGVTTPPNP